MSGPFDHPDDCEAVARRIGADLVLSWYPAPGTIQPVTARPSFDEAQSAARIALDVLIDRGWRPPERITE